MTNYIVHLRRTTTNTTTLEIEAENDDEAWDKGQKLLGAMELGTLTLPKEEWEFLRDDFEIEEVEEVTG